MVHSSDSPASFPSRLKQAMANAGYGKYGDATRLAKALDITPKAVSKWLNGESVPTPARMIELSKLLNVRAEWLMWGKEAIDMVLGSVRVKPNTQDFALSAGLIASEAAASYDPASRQVDSNPATPEAVSEQVVLNARLEMAGGGARSLSVDPSAALARKVDADAMKDFLLTMLAADLGEFAERLESSDLIGITLTFKDRG